MATPINLCFPRGAMPVALRSCICADAHLQDLSAGLGGLPPKPYDLDLDLALALDLDLLDLNRPSLRLGAV